MEKIVHKADSRGYADHGWLKAKHTFSFANYYNPERVHFGVLRVLNDDIIAPGMGFGTHPHDNMEIITIPLSGSIRHEDSMGNSSVIKAGEIQVMSAGSGVFHSEYNASKSEPLNLFQIWLFTNKKNVDPRYDQMSLSELEKKNQFYQVLSPNKDDAGVWVYQDAWFSMAKFDPGFSAVYGLKKSGNGIYIMVISGEVYIENEFLKSRDGIALTDFNEIKVSASTKTELLIMDIPMVN